MGLGVVAQAHALGTWARVSSPSPCLPQPNTRKRIFLGLHASYSVFYIDLICIILSII